MLNGTLMSGETAGKIMFVQCTLLKKAYTVNTIVTPIEVTIHEYEMSESDVKSYDGRKIEESEHYVETVKKAGCGTCGKKEETNINL